MVDERIKKLAYNLVSYSTKVKKGEKVLIDLFGQEAIPLGKELVKEVYNAGGLPVVKIYNEEITNELIKGGNKESFNLTQDIDFYEMNKMDAYIGIRASKNINNNSNILRK